MSSSSSRKKLLSQLSESQSQRYAAYSNVDGGLARQLEDCYKVMGEKCIQLSEELASCHEGAVPEDMQERLGLVMKDTIRQQQVFDKLSECVGEMEEDTVPKTDGSKNLKKLEKELDAVAASTRNKLEAVLRDCEASEGDVESHPNWTRFLGALRKGDNSQINDSQGMDGEDDDEEEEEPMDLSDGEGGMISTQGDIIPLVDPISQKALTDPIKNTKCGHIYGKDAIIELLRRNKKMRCPTIGCSNRAVITVKDLKEDKELTRKVKKRLALAKQKSQQASSRE